MRASREAIFVTCFEHTSDTCSVKLQKLIWSDRMKGLIFVVLIVFGLFFSALETHGQPVPDQEEEVVDSEIGGTLTDLPGASLCTK